MILKSDHILGDKTQNHLRQNDGKICNFLIMIMQSVQFLNDGRMMVYFKLMVVKCSLMMVKCSLMMVKLMNAHICTHFTNIDKHFTLINEHFTIINEHFTIINEHFTIIAQSKPLFAHSTIIEKLLRLYCAMIINCFHRGLITNS